jgi:hypothetical protein
LDGNQREGGGDVPDVAGRNAVARRNHRRNFDERMFRKQKSRAATRASNKPLKKQRRHSRTRRIGDIDALRGVPE